MICPDLAGPSSELNHYVQFPGKNHMLTAYYVFFLIFTALGLKPFATFVILAKTPTFESRVFIEN